jgi:hypothetical protein
MSHRRGRGTRTLLAVLPLLLIAISSLAPASASDSVSRSPGVTEEWVARFHSPRPDGDQGDHGKALGLDAAGNVYVAGNNGASNQNGYGPDFQVVKYDGAGNEQWARTWDRGSRLDDWVYGLAVDPAGFAYVTGVSYKDPEEQDGDIAVIKYGPAGGRKWVRIEDSLGGGYDNAYDIALDDAGNLYVTGVWSGLGIYETEVVTIKYDSAGNRLWLVTYGGPGGADAGNAITLDAAGNVYVAGRSWADADAYDYLILKYDPAGTLMWARTYDASEYFDEAHAVGVDGAGNVYVTGTAWRDGSFDDIGTIKFSRNGNQRWARLYSAYPTGLDEGADLALDGAGNVYVTGTSFVGYQDHDYTTIKYDAAGNQVWVAHHDAPEYSTDYDSAEAVEILPSGNLVVTGYAGPLYGSDYATVKYDSSTGSEVWAAEYDGYPGDVNGWDIVHDMAVGADGEVYVTGESAGGSTGWDMATIKYSDT